MKTRTSLRAWIVAVFLSILITEAVSTAYVGFTQGFIPISRLFTSIADEDAKANEITDTRQKLSPIYGYGLRPGWRPKDVIDDQNRQLILEMIGEETLPAFWSLPANNFGFLSRHDYPHLKSSREEIIVAVVGGSVANGFALEVEDRIVNAVRGSLGKAAAKVTVLNFAMGGFKQPQQVTLLSYFLAIGQEIDFVINMDGLNEAYISWLNVTEGNVHFSLPYQRFMFGLLNNYLTPFTDGDVETYRRLARNTPSAIVYLYSEALRSRSNFKRQIAESEIGSRVPGRIYPIIMPTTPTPSIDELAVDIADTWMRGSRTLDALARRFGATYLHFLQPNQYVSRKPISPEEARMAFSNPPWEGKEIVEKVYPLLISRGRDLVEEGIDFTDLTPAFDTTDDILYFDACCHFRRLGYEKLMDSHIDAAIIRAGKMRPSGGAK